jgi:glyoxylase-like metal-dependent hydrolase (beta-lactamase superfamily II)
MQIDKGIRMLKISATIMGKTETIHPTLIWDENDVVLIDTAYPGQFPILINEVTNAGLSIEKLSKIIITHQDLDHIGSLPAILERCAYKVEVLANPIEKPYIQGEEKLLKITPEAITEAMNSLPEGVPDEWKIAFKHTLENPPKAIVNTTVANEEELPLCGGIIIINTPGHTPGHICLYHKPSKTLIAADALIVEDGELFGPDPKSTYDINLAKKSLENLMDYDIQKVICYHGGLYNGNSNKRIAELVEK